MHRFGFFLEIKNLKQGEFMIEQLYNIIKPLIYTLRVNCKVVKICIVYINTITLILYINTI
jgi:uncharacterized protein YhhL (DUF1145 family)